MSYHDALERIMEQCRGMTIADVDYDLVVILSGNPHAAIMYQAARSLDALGIHASAIPEDDDATVTQRVGL
jgi:hypothetical protein